MFLRMLQRANYLITQYQIFEFPVPIETITKVITDKRIKVFILNNITEGSVFSDTMVIPNNSIECVRDHMAHEYCHAMNHCQNFYTDRLQITKNEAQAKAFAAYFLMPVFIFESDIKQGLNDYELSENFGVCIELIQYRKTLTEALINIDYFKGDEKLWKAT